MTLSPLVNCQAAITFNFTYQDVISNTGFGFDDASEGVTRRATVNAVANYLSSILDHTATVDVFWNTSSNAPSSSNLGSMGTSYFLNQGVYLGLLGRHIQDGVDPSLGNNDASGSINFGKNWNSDFNQNVSSGENDLYSTVLHEMTHALGFSSLITATGSSAITGTYSLYDTFLKNSTGTALVDGSGNFQGNVSDLTSQSLTFGPNNLSIFSPASFQYGSSLSHLNATNSVMNPSRLEGTQIREHSAADLEVLSTIGYTIIPEPSSALLFVLGSFMALRRRR